MPTQHFYKLKEEKQKQIIAAGLKEFAQYGYDAASTNRMVEAANISKGVLFKYFNTKEELFLFICEQKSIEKAAWMITDYELPEDLFDILREYTVREMKYYREEPEFFMITQQIKMQPDHPVYKKVLEIMKNQSGTIAEKLFSNLPSDKLREGLSIAETLNFINWVFEGFNRTIDGDMRSQTWEEDTLGKVERMFELIKYGVYKAKN
jgi:TetR/AcrR family transcriptional regulator